jgi:predicted nucleic acid-binding protein
MSRIFWDTNLFVYLLEDNPDFSPYVENLRIRMLTRGDQLLTSTMTVGEVLVKPMRAGDEERCRRYEKMILTSSQVIPMDVAASRHYASIRCDRFIRPPDAIQLSCAASVGVDLFVTNDTRLQGKCFPGIQFIAPLDNVPI